MKRHTRSRAMALLIVGGWATLASAAELPTADSPEAVQCRAGEAAGCAALIRAIRAQPTHLPATPQQACVAALQDRLLDQIDCRRGHTDSCTSAPVPAASDACPAGLEPAVRAQLGLDAGATLPVAPSLDAAYWRSHLPRYPAAAFRAGIEGEAVLRVEVSAEGRAIGMSVASSSGSRDLDRAAMEALRTHPFVPATANGRAVIGRTRVSVPFVIGGRQWEAGSMIDMRSVAAPSP